MVSYGYVSFGFGSGFLALVAFVILHWLNLPAGSLIDWVIGVASFWWLLAIVTIPWNIYFEAKSVIQEAALSRQAKISVNPEQVRYARNVARWALVLAIALHGFSALGLYGLAAGNISAVGYVASGLTLLLTFLRPATRAYQYLAERLQGIKQTIKYPREDVIALGDRVMALETQIEDLTYKLWHPENKESWERTHEREWQTLRNNLQQQRAQLEAFQSTNATEHAQLTKEAHQAIAQLTEDSQFLEQVREIIRFFKKA